MGKGRTTTVFFCQNCGYESSKWMGQCPGCRQWNTLVEETVPAASKGANGMNRTKASARQEPSSLSAIAMQEEERVSTHIQELDRVLGGGIVPGSLMLVGGDPGIGKSTLLLQVCRHLSDDGRKVLYISGEESLKQIKLRAVRLGEFTDHLLLLCETNLGSIEEIILQQKPEAVVIDSIQTMYHDAVSAAPGSVSQVREATGVLLRLAKSIRYNGGMVRPLSVLREISALRMGAGSFF